MKLKRIGAVTAALALAAGLAGCGEEDRTRGTVPVDPGPGAGQASPAPVDPTSPPDPGTDPGPTAPPTDVATQPATGATFSLDGEALTVNGTTCWSFETMGDVPVYTGAASAYAMDADGNERSIMVSAEGDYIHYVALTEWGTLLGEWGDTYLENDPTASVTGDVFSVSGTIRMTDGTTSQIEATIPCTVDGTYEGFPDSTFVAPELVTRQSFDLSAALAATESAISIDGVAVPNVSGAQCTDGSDGYRNLKVSGITETGGTVDVTIAWQGTGRAPNIDVSIDEPDGEWFWYYWSEGYSEDNPPAISWNGNTYAMGGTVADYSGEHKVVVTIVCP